MALPDIQAYLEPVSEALPAGEALDYDLDFLELETAARGRAEQRLGDSVVPAEHPDWAAVLQLALALAQRTKDLRIGIIAARAALNVDGYEGLRQGLELLAGYVENYWPDLHPCPDDGDDADQTVRLNALANLCDRDEFLDDIGRVPLTQSRRFGAFSFRDHIDAQRPSEEAEGSERLRPEAIEGAFSETDPALLDRASAGLRAALAAVARIDNAIAQRVDSTNSFRLDQLSGLLRQILELVDAHRPVAHADAPAEVSAVAVPETTEIRDRGDIVSMLERICRWYRVNEPASPVPSLLERTKRLVSKDFMSLLLELAPDGVAQFRAVTGLEPDGTPRGSL
jgi:type VI secretion system protein ImpA